MKVLVDAIDDLIEECKEKEYMVFSKSSTMLSFNKYEFTKKELLRFMESHELWEFIVFKINDKIKTNKYFEIVEKGV